MELTLKKRLIGFLILIALALLILPFFFGQSVPIRELQLSARQPEPPTMPVNFNIPIPPQAATTPPLANAATGGTADTNSRIASEQVQTLAATSTPATSTVSATEQVTPASSIASAAANPVNTPSPDNAPSAATMPAPSYPPTTPVSASAANTPAAESTTLKVSKPQAITNPVAPTHLATHHAHPNVASPDAFAVQLGSFSDKINAENLMKKLQAQGFTAYIHTTKTATGTWVRVLVGPELHRADAQALQSKLQKATNLPSMVVKAGFK